MNAEVCVVGGGPAGAAVAARLAALGHDVVVVERERFPRPHIGESLSPAAWPVLDALGARELVAEAGFARVVQARVLWREGQERVPSPSAGGLTVDRAAFDAILLDRARAAGARVLTATARVPVARAGGWDVPLAGGSTIRARWLADASGRRRLLGGRRMAIAPRTLALHATWREPPPSDGEQTRIEAIADGWLWGARLPGGAFRVIAFVDPQTLVRAGREHARERLYRELLASSALFAGLPAGGAPASAVQACDATSYATADPIGERAVKVGEAAFAIDPLSSSGVQTAIQTGLAAAAAVHTILAPDGDRAAAAEFYREHQRHSVERHAATAAGVYAEHVAHRERDFWRVRSAAPAPAADVAPGDPPPPLDELLGRPVRLSATAALRATPCLVGDHVELRRALTGPALARPVAFLGGSELAPLLDALPRAPSLADAMRDWARQLQDPSRPGQIARWLHARALIEVAP